MMRGLLPHYPSVTMIAAPQTERTLGRSVTKNSKKNSPPAVPLRGPQAKVIR
jgi:hypothetical protein